MVNKNKSSAYRKPKLKLIIIVMVLILAILLTLELSGATNFYQKPLKTNPESTQPTINLDPPTNQERTEGDNKKQDIVDKANDSQPDEQNSGSSSKKTVTVIITDASQYDDVVEVRSFVPNHFQNGICKIVFTKDGKEFSKETPAYTDASTTICTNPLIKTSEFPSKGNWQVKVIYSSKDAIGESSSKDMDIQ